jgi:hypothetical protein
VRHSAAISFGGRMTRETLPEKSKTAWDGAFEQACANWFKFIMEMSCFGKGEGGAGKI